MPPDTKPIELTLQLHPGEDYDLEELDRLTRQALVEMQDLEVESVTLVKGGAAPRGTKSAELVTLGTLAVSVLPNLAPKLIDFLQSWSLRGENRTVKIKAQVADRSIEVEYSPASMSTDELKRLVNTLTEALPPAPAAQG